MNRRLAAAAALLGFVTVALGAFGAHGLEGRLGAEAIGWWETATFYGLVHASAGLTIAVSGAPHRLAAGGWVMVAGAALFSATLYTMALGAPTWLGAITPFGGVGMLFGWFLVGARALKR